MKPDKISSYIGFAAKSKNVVSGGTAVEKSIKNKKARIVIIAIDASANTKKRFINMCEYYGACYAVLKTKEELGNIIGKEFTACIAINNEGLANVINRVISQ